MRRLTIALFALSILAACGGGTGSDNPPDVAGIYACTNGCDGVCTFADTLTVTQSGSQATATSTAATCTGTINNEGHFSGTCTGNSQTCEGDFVAGVLTATCTVDGDTCQTVAYTQQ